MYGKWIYFAVCYIVIGLDVPKQKSNQRNGQCARFMGVDIGVYDTCGHLCKYCYANANTGLVKANMKRHDPKSPFLIGGDMPNNCIQYWFHIFFPMDNSQEMRHRFGIAFC